MQVKLFWVRRPVDKDIIANDVENQAIAFERQINAWLMLNRDIEIIHIKQSACGGSWAPPLWLVSVWYAYKNGAEKQL